MQLASAIGLVLLVRPCSAEPKGARALARIGLAAALGWRSYDGDTQGAGDSDYFDHFGAIGVSAALGVSYQFDKRWALGIEGVGFLLPSVGSGTSVIPGAPADQLAVLGAEAFARASFEGWARPAFTLSGGFVRASFGSSSDAIRAPRFVADDSAFQGMSGLTAAVVFEPRVLGISALLLPFCEFRIVRLWHNEAAATIVMPTVGISFLR